MENTYYRKGLSQLVPLVIVGIVVVFVGTYFLLQDRSQPEKKQIELLYPQGGERFEVGKVAEIRWRNSIEDESDFFVYLVSKNCIESGCFDPSLQIEKTVWPDIFVVARVSDTGSFAWDVPESFLYALGEYKVFVLRAYEVLSGRFYDESPGFITIIGEEPKATTVPPSVFAIKGGDKLGDFRVEAVSITDPIAPSFRVGLSGSTTVEGKIRENEQAGNICLFINEASLKKIPAVKEKGAPSEFCFRNNNSPRDALSQYIGKNVRVEIKNYEISWVPIGGTSDLADFVAVK